MNSQWSRDLKLSHSWTSRTQKVWFLVRLDTRLLWESCQGWRTNRHRSNPVTCFDNDLGNVYITFSRTIDIANRYPAGSACKLTELHYVINMTCRNHVVIRDTQIFQKSVVATCKFCTPKGRHAESSTTILGATIQNASFLIILGLYWKIVFCGRVFNVKNK